MLGGAICVTPTGSLTPRQISHASQDNLASSNNSSSSSTTTEDSHHKSSSEPVESLHPQEDPMVNGELYVLAR